MRRTLAVACLFLLAGCSSTAETTRVSRARLLNSSGCASFERGDLQAAAADFSLALEESRKIDDLAEKARALNNIGRVAEAQGHYAEAEDNYRSALQVTEQMENPVPLRITVLLNIGSVLGHMNRLEESRRYCEEALALAEARDDSLRRADALKSLAVLDRRAGDLDEAYVKMSQAYRQFEIAGDRSSQAQALYNLGVILEQRGMIKEAMGRFSSSHQIFKTTGNREGIAVSLAGLARGYDRLGQPRNAVVWYRRAADVNLGIPNLERAKHCLEALEQLHTNLGTNDDLEEAGKIHQEIERLDGSS